jgi:hypothetical protein
MAGCVMAGDESADSRGMRDAPRPVADSSARGARVELAPRRIDDSSASGARDRALVASLRAGGADESKR